MFVTSATLIASIWNINGIAVCQEVKGGENGTLPGQIQCGAAWQIGLMGEHKWDSCPWGWPSLPNPAN